MSLIESIFGGLAEKGREAFKEEENLRNSGTNIYFLSTHLTTKSYKDITNVQEISINKNLQL
jgi:hypothetical protein